MERKYTFNEVAEQYEKYRPAYPAEVFEAIIQYAGLSREKEIVEIGCGTGQVTSGFVSRGYSRVTCIELGEKLAALTRAKFKDAPGLQVLHTSFEDWQAPSNHYRLAVSGTAFHFIEPVYGYRKVFQCLQPGGSMGFFWTVHVPQYDALFDAIRQSYRQYAPHLDDSKGPTPEQVIDQRRKWTEDANLFQEIEVKTYSWFQDYTAEEYVALLNTNSRHQLLEERNRQSLFQGIEEAIRIHGGLLRKAQMVALYLGRKP